MRLSSGYPPETVEAASKEAIDKGILSHKYFSIIFRQIASKAPSPESEKIVLNSNVRETETYAGGGINA